jgi:putative PIN family toxin of toxin-antitoxin system
LPVQAVVDTNVLVSALIAPNGTPAQLIELIRSGGLVPVVSPAVLAEYAEVLHRPRFGFPSDWVDDLLSDMTGLSLIAQPGPIDTRRLPDPADAPFVALARHFACAIVTGNVRHFPKHTGVEVLRPAECLAMVLGRAGSRSR